VLCRLHSVGSGLRVLETLLVVALVDVIKWIQDTRKVVVKRRSVKVSIINFPGMDYRRIFRNCLKSTVRSVLKLSSDEAWILSDGRINDVLIF